MLLKHPGLTSASRSLFIQIGGIARADRWHNVSAMVGLSGRGMSSCDAHSGILIPPDMALGSTGYAVMRLNRPDHHGQDCHNSSVRTGSCSRELFHIRASSSVPSRYEYCPKTERPF